VRSILVRAGIIAGLYYVFLLVLLREDALTALIISAIGFALMVPLGLLFDRLRYRSQMKRWQRSGADGG
jgi:hypothetical protein